ncbi:MAG: beta-lactamase family protein [Ignavibacteriales bacterium]|nr:beta-lactamase family protein [Ignavibacteriales bacterium]MCF8314833.1 beta-lactamase family protein [Ignavibacteriales bacterium]MCF8436218.1 beta-lactamase family protein [Ignavibacteriales bacterium]
MKTRSYILFLSLILAYSLGAQTQQQQFDDLIAKYAEYERFSGVVLVADSTGIVFNKAYGKANFELNVPNTIENKFRIGSVTKQFTAFIIAKLIEENKLSPDDNIAKFLDYYRKDIAEKVTVYQLITHTSGIPGYTENPDFFGKLSRQFFTTEEFITKMCSDDLFFEPGTEYVYSNSGYFILGAIIEQVTGLKYEDALKKYITEPLGMTSTGYDHSEKIISLRSSGYENEEGVIKNCDFIDMSSPFSAGAMYSASGDLYKWDRGLYDKNFAGPQLIDRIFTPSQWGYAYGWQIWQAEHPSNGAKYGIQHHTGGIDGFTAYIYRIPELKQVYIILNNLGSAPMRQMQTGLFRILNGAEAEFPKLPLSYALRESSLPLDSAEFGSRVDQLLEEAKAYIGFSPSELIKYSNYLSNNGYSDDAIKVLRENIKRFPEFAENYKLAADIKRTDYDRRGEIEFLRKWLEKDKSNEEAYRRLKDSGETTEGFLPYKLAESDMVGYGGKFQLAPEFTISIFLKNGNLYARATNQPAIKLVPEEMDIFKSIGVEAKFKFVRDDSNNIISLILLQGGREMPATKI